jgi:clan AA aspartic protease
MISGVVNASRKPVIRLTVRGPVGQEQEIEAVIDTGFTGFLTMPPALIASLGLNRRGGGRALLADGSVHVLEVYEGVVLWDGQPRRIAAHAADAEVLVGISLLYGHDLTIRALDGGPVTIEVIS